MLLCSDGIASFERIFKTDSVSDSLFFFGLLQDELDDFLKLESRLIVVVWDTLAEDGAGFIDSLQGVFFIVVVI